MKLQWLGYIAAYCLWAVTLVLSLLFLLIGRTSFPLLISTSLIDKEYYINQWAIVIDRFFIFGGGIAWIALMVITEYLFRTGVPNGTLWKRAARIIGILLILIFVADSAQVLWAGTQGVSTIRWLILLGEIGLGVLLTVFSYRKSVGKPLQTTDAATR